MISPDRLVDEMALILCGVAELRDDGACAIALSTAGFRARAIYEHLDEARERTRRSLEEAT